MVDSRLSRPTVLAAAVTALLLVVSGALGQEGGAADEPLTKEEFRQFLEEYRQLRADMTELSDENKSLKSTLADVQNELTNLKQERSEAGFEQAMAIQRAELLESMSEKLERETRSLLPGTNNLMITGFASATFQNRENADSTFGAMFAPILLWKPTDELFFESELHFMLGEEETHVDLGYAQIGYLLNDYITLGFGKFLLPFGTFAERFHPAWINKLPTAPLTANLVGESGLGFQVRGGAPLGPTKINYAVYVINGPGFGSTLTNAGRLGFDRNLDNNNNKAVGGRFGFLPVPELEIGCSILGGRVGDSGSDHHGVDTLMYGVDFAYARQFIPIKGRIDFRGEVIWVDTDDVIFTGPFVPFTFHNKRNGWYFQAAYRPTLLDFKLGDMIEFRNFEFIIRYDHLRQPGPDRLGLDRDQLTLGVDY